MRIGEGISVGVTAIYTNRRRSLLTILGIIIGVASVLAMIAIGDGAKTIVLEETEKFGGASQFTMRRSSWILRDDRWVCSGLIGIGLGMAAAAYGMAYVATQVVKVVDYWPSMISYEWMIVSVTFSAAVGSFFELYPAMKAARLSPIEALRTE